MSPQTSRISEVERALRARFVSPLGAPAARRHFRPLNVQRSPASCRARACATPPAPLPLRARFPRRLTTKLRTYACALVIGHCSLVISSATTAAPTAAVDASLASKFIGAWKLVAIRERDAATSAEINASRPGIGGQLIYTANGRLSVQIIREGREKAPAGSSDGFSSYFGTWRILPSEGCVVHEQEWNINHAQSGQSAKRYYSFNDLGHLSLATPVRKRDSDGKDIQMVFVWSRIP